MGKITDALKKIEQERELLKKIKSENISSQDKAARPQPTAALDHSIQTKDGGKKVVYRPTLEERLKSRVHVSRATDDSGIDPSIVSYFNPVSPAAEQYRILRTNLHAKSMNKTTKTFLISSCAHGEGKTVTATNLAVTLAQDLDKKVFLMDCDLRAGNVHQLLNLNIGPGLAEVLSNVLPLKDAFQNSKIKNLTVLSRGGIPKNPAELLGSKSLRRLLEALEAEFDYVILDSPPILPITDAAILGAQADGVVFVVQAQETQAHRIKHALELLEQARAKIIGFVFTQTDRSLPDYYSYYYHYQAKKSKGAN